MVKVLSAIRGTPCAWALVFVGKHLEIGPAITIIEHDLGHLALWHGPGTQAMNIPRNQHITGPDVLQFGSNEFSQFMFITYDRMTAQVKTKCFLLSGKSFFIIPVRHLDEF